MTKFYKAAPEQDIFQYHSAATAQAKLAKLEKKTAETAAKLAKLEKKTTKINSGGLSNILSTAAKRSSAHLLSKKEIADISDKAAKLAVETAAPFGVDLKKKGAKGYISSHIVFQAIDMVSKKIGKNTPLEADLVSSAIAGKVLEQMAEDTDNPSLLLACFVVTANGILASNAPEGLKKQTAKKAVEVMTSSLFGRQVDLPNVEQLATELVSAGKVSEEIILSAALKNLEEGLIQLSEDEELKLRLKARMSGIEVVEVEEEEPTTASAEPSSEAPTLVPGSFKIL